MIVLYLIVSIPIHRLAPTLIPKKPIKGAGKRECTVVIKRQAANG
jgi:hypothetical protein